MSVNYEFRRQNLRQRTILYGLRAAVIGFIAFDLYRMATGEDRSARNLLLHAGSIFTAIWFHSNLLQVKYEVQELFVPPYNTLNGLEYMLLGFFCFMGATVLLFL